MLLSKKRMGFTSMKCFKSRRPTCSVGVLDYIISLISPPWLAVRITSYFEGVPVVQLEVQVGAQSEVLLDRMAQRTEDAVLHVPVCVEGGGVCGGRRGVCVGCVGGVCVRV